MDDMQFNQSLDDLLAGENLRFDNYGTNGASFSEQPGIEPTTPGRNVSDVNLDGSVDNDDDNNNNNGDRLDTAVGDNILSSRNGGDGGDSDDSDPDKLNDIEPLDGVEPTRISYGVGGSYHHQQQQQEQQQYLTVSTQQVFPQVAQYGISVGGMPQSSSSSAAAAAAAAVSVPSGGNLPQGYDLMTSGGLCLSSVKSSGASVSSAISRDSSSRRRRNKRRRDSMSKSDATEISEDENGDKRRQDRNFREQQRSQKISQQIEHLRDLLSSANVPFKPDKFSTLATVVEYIKQLQQRSAVLDSEHKKLVETISRSNQVVNESHLPVSARLSSSTISDTSGTMSSTDGLVVGNTAGLSNPMVGAASDVAPEGVVSEQVVAGGGTCVRNDNEQSTPEDGEGRLHSIDYRTIFFRTVVPLAVASIDGRFFDCNPEFERITGYSRNELLPAMMEPQNNRLALSVGGRLGLGSSSRAIPDITTSSAAVNSASVTTADDNVIFSSSVDSTARNMSLFNILCREDMEEVFVVLSEMLKYVPTPEDALLETSTPVPSTNDFWSGKVRINRHSGLQVRFRFRTVKRCIILQYQETAVVADVAFILFKIGI